MGKVNDEIANAIADEIDKDIPNSKLINKEVQNGNVTEHHITLEPITPKLGLSKRAKKNFDKIDWSA